MKHIRGGVEPWYVLSMTCGSIPNRWSMKWNMLLAQTQIPTQTQTPQHGAEMFARNVCPKCLPEMFARNVCPKCLPEMFARRSFRL